MVQQQQRPSRNELTKHVFSGIAFVMELPGNGPFDLHANLHKTLGLQSEDAADLACYLSKALNIEIADDVNLLREDHAGQKVRLRTVGDLVDFLDELCQCHKQG